MRLIIVSGRSGSGKSIALRAFEDMGFYCVDNIPITLLSDLAQKLKNNNAPVAISLDIRNLPENLSILSDVISALPDFIAPELLFLESSRHTLIRRYSESRRAHPLLEQYGSLEKAIDHEHLLLAPIRDLSDLIISTDNLSVHELNDMLRQRILGKKDRELTIVLESFGFKYGLPSESDFVFDVRFLPNPHWDNTLRTLTGLDEKVQIFLESHKDVVEFIKKTYEYLAQWLPLLKKNNRSYLTISIGCTGGQHRSVYITETLAKLLKRQDFDVQIRHRTLEKNLHKMNF